MKKLHTKSSFTFRNILVIAFLFLPQLYLLAQEDYYKADFLRYEDYIYKENIHTMLIHREGFELAHPVIALNTNEKLLLSFDDFSDNATEYGYSIIHCDANWQASDLVFNEYAMGFEQDYIDDYQFSFNTVQSFVHYKLIFPNPNLTPTLSGNYLIKVFERDHPDELVLTARFMIIDAQVRVNAKPKPATEPSQMHSSQEIDFNINHENFHIPDAYRSLKVVLMQNGRYDNAITNLKPREIRGDIIDYDYNKENVFNGINEFRQLNLKSLRYPSARVAHIENRKFENHIHLLPDPVRTYKPYSFYEDINGRKLIKTEDYENSDIEADYVYVHFTLPYDTPLANGNLYILGNITNWQFLDKAKLKYNYNRKAYEATLMLKQGFYNFHYVFLESGKEKGDATFIEGNHFETQNEYTILVYYRETGTTFDQLIGMEKVLSNQY
ncbi:MAG: DUF5103 domain-containing protein [Bacteroidales bacterium]|nr:DUF5103 domain-containing protein [Bacteroidales bacterium]